MRFVTLSVPSRDRAASCGLESVEGEAGAASVGGNGRDALLACDGVVAASSSDVAAACRASYSDLAFLTQDSSTHLKYRWYSSSCISPSPDLSHRAKSWAHLSASGIARWKRTHMRSTLVYASILSSVPLPSTSCTLNSASHSRRRSSLSLSTAMAHCMPLSCASSLASASFTDARLDLSFLISLTLAIAPSLSPLARNCTASAFSASITRRLRAPHPGVPTRGEQTSQSLIECGTIFEHACTHTRKSDR